MSTIKPYQDVETRRQYRNLTSTQQKNISEMKEGVVVNTLIKESNLTNMYDSLIIPDRVKYQDYVLREEPQKPKSLKALLFTTTAVFGGLAAAMTAIAGAAKHRTKLPAWKTLPEVPKNIAINNEPHFVTYLMIQDPNTKTILGALGVFLLSAIGLVGKNFVDGVKDIWVRKKEADIQKDLQEKLIAVETRSFAGKMQIQRNMLSEKAHELDDILQENNLSRKNLAFRQFLNFGKTDKNTAKSSESNDFKTLAMTGLTTAVITGLGYLAFKNVQKTAQYYKNYEKEMLAKIQNLIAGAKISSEDLEYIKKLFVSLRVPSGYIRETFSKISKTEDGIDLKKFSENLIKEAEQISQKGAEAIAGSPGNKPSYYSHTNDDRAHLYNMIVNWENPLLKILFAGMTTVTSVGYAGTKIVEAIKSVEVTRENAKTELELQNRLVNVELKNFETKKRSVIEPLIDEFRIQAQNGKDKNELKVRAENILYEIKNGPPFVYS